MPTYPYACDSHSWANGEIATADLLNRHPRGELGGDQLTGDITGITGIRTICKVGGGSGPNIVYGDSRIIKVSAYGTARVPTGDELIARLFWDSSEIAYWPFVADLNVLTDTDIGISLWARVYPGASGAASAAVTIERIGVDPVTAFDGFMLSIEDIGSTTHLHG